MQSSESMKIKPPETAILHYTGPPVVGGVEAVIQSHVEIFTQAQFSNFHYKNII